MSEILCIPHPRKIARVDGEFRIPAAVQVSIRRVNRESIRFFVDTLQRAVGIRASCATTGKEKNSSVRLCVMPELFRQGQAYRLRVRSDGIEILAADPAGLWYGIATLRQVVRQARRGRIPCLFIEDWPDFPHRGVMLDISRDKVPTMETLYALVDDLSALKVNHLQLYTEHTFAYRRHREVWRDASPMTALEIRALDAYCRERFVELVPNQNSFGHMERWFRHPRYRPLSEAPEGFFLGSHRFPWGSTLCPVDPRSIRLLKDLYAELLPCFSSRQFNGGCDEPRELGQGRSKEVCDRLGKGRVYLEFLLKIHREVARHGRVMQFWGDIILRHPELIPELPSDAIAMVWGYEDDHPFAEQCKKFAASGLSFFVCPGTSSWNSIGGRTSNALGNLSAAAAAGLSSGAVGFLNTDWGDNGHWQPLSVSYLPFAYGAAVSWCSSANREMDVARACSTHVFLDPTGTMGTAAYRLGDISAGVGGRTRNCSSLFRILFGALKEDLFAAGPLAEATEQQCAAAEEEADRILDLLATAHCGRRDGALVKAELRQAASLLRLAARIGAARLRTSDRGWSSVPERVRSGIREEFHRLWAIQKRVWLKRNRPGGLQDSLARLAGLREDASIRAGGR